MQAIFFSREAQLHRESYIAALNGLLTTPASKRELAKRAGISPQYLSYLLNPYDRTPSPAVAERIVAALRLEADERNNLLEHLLLANERHLQARQLTELEVLSHNPTQQFIALQQLEQHVNFDQDPRHVKIEQQTLRSLGMTLLAQLAPTRSPLQSAQLCLWLNSVENSLNLPANALYFAKKARLLLDQTTQDELPVQDRLHYNELVANALRSEAVAYHNLKLPRQAFDCCVKAESTSIVKSNAKHYLPHLYRDKMNAYSGMARFSIHEVETWAKRGVALCEQHSHQEAPLWAFMLNRSLADAYLRFGATKKAEGLLSRLAYELEQLPVVGTLHRVCFLRSYAELLWVKGDGEAWKAVVTAAVQLATAAGFRHQIGLLKQRYGEEIQPILNYGCDTDLSR